MPLPTPRPTTLQDAILLFASDTPLAPIYGLEHEPGAQQRALVLYVLRCVEQGGPQDVLFPGAAGTGKTTMLKLLLMVFSDCGISFAMGAPTHKAAGRASESLDGRWPVTTHHRWWCGSAEEAIEEGEEFSDDLHLGVADDRTMSERVLVIDEASMVSEQDLANIRTVAAHAIIVAVGDPHQLPPVKALPGFDWSNAEHGLTDVFRQPDGSSVLDAATAIRNQRVPYTWSKVANWKAGTAILREAGVPSRWITSQEAGFTLAQALRGTDGDAACVVGTHVSRVLVNDATRACLGLPPREHGPAVGERLVARSTAGGIANAMSCTVISCTPQDFGERFGAGWILRVRTENGRTRETAILEQQWRLVDSPANRGKIPYSVRQMLGRYADEDQGAHGVAIAARLAPREEAHDGDVPSWRMDLWRAEAARDLGAWGIYLSKRLAALDTGYAVTCHAAQGSQWRKVMVVADWVDFLAEDPRTGNVNPDHVYRWSYTALTRAVESALVVCKSRGGWVRPSPVTGVRIGSASRDWQARRRSR